MPNPWPVATAHHQRAARLLEPVDWPVPASEPTSSLLATEPSDDEVDPTTWRRVRRVVQLVVEVLSGQRNPLHLSGCFDPEALDLLATLGRQPDPRRRLASVRMQRPELGVIEVVCRITEGDRSCAVALRLTDDPARIVCTHLEAALAPIPEGPRTPRFSGYRVVRGTA